MKKQTLTDRRLSKFDRSFRSEAHLRTGKGQELEEIVNNHGVTWDFWPEYHMDRDGKRIQIGFEFGLMGTHQHPDWIVEPGCPECITIYEDLQRIAEWVAPKERRKGLYEIVIADASPYYSFHRRFRPEVLLVIRLIKREGFESSVDPSEAKCLMEMKRRAKELGIPRYVGPSLNAEFSAEVH